MLRYPIVPGYHDNVGRLTALGRPSYTVGAQSAFHSAQQGLTTYDRIDSAVRNSVFQLRRRQINAGYIPDLYAVQDKKPAEIELTDRPEGNAYALPFKIGNIFYPAVSPAQNEKILAFVDVRDYANSIFVEGLADKGVFGCLGDVHITVRQSVECVQPFGVIPHSDAKTIPETEPHRDRRNSHDYFHRSHKFNG
jgi:hypothetical protein